MEDYNKDALMKKFMNAHNAGDTRSAKLLKNMISKLDSGSTPKAKSWELPDGGLRFDKLQDNTQYVDDLKKFHMFQNDGKTFEGTNEELIEDSFEYFNSSFNNELSLVGTMNDIRTMDDDTKSSMSNIFNTYNNTNITGEGSRSLKEQAKDAASLLWAPSTYFGGRFIAGGAMNVAAKTGVKKLLAGSAAKRSGLVAGGVVGAHDAAQQVGVEMELNEDQEFDWGRAAMTTGMGYGLGALAPVAIKGAAKLVGGVGSTATGTAKAVTSPLETAGNVKGGVIKAIGGGEAARLGVVSEIKDTLNASLGKGGKEEAAAGLGDDLTSVVSKGKEKFTNQYNDLGEIDVTGVEVQRLVSQLHNKSGVQRIGNLDSTVDAMIGGELTPTQALRKVRSTLGKESNRATRGVGPNISSDQVLNNFYKQSRKMFTNAADKSGKGKVAKQLDKDYSEFLKIKGNRKIINAQEDHSAATRKLVQTISSKDPHKIDEFITEMNNLGRLSGDAEFGARQQQNLQKTLHEHLFTGTSAAPLKRFLGDASGIKVLQKVYSGVMDKQAWKGFADILENSSDHKGMGMLMSRLVAAGSGGQALGPLGMIAGLSGFSSLMRSKWMRKNAMKVFSNNPKKKKEGLGQIAKYLEGKGVDAAGRKKIQNLLVGTGTIATGVAAVKTSQDDVQMEMVRNGLKNLDPSIAKYFDE